MRRYRGCRRLALSNMPYKVFQDSLPDIAVGGAITRLKMLHDSHI